MLREKKKSAREGSQIKMIKALKEDSYADSGVAAAPGPVR